MSSSGATSASGAADYVPSSIDAKSFDIEEVIPEIPQPSGIADASSSSTDDAVAEEAVEVEEEGDAKAMAEMQKALDDTPSDAAATATSTPALPTPPPATDGKSVAAKSAPAAAENASSLLEQIAGLKLGDIPFLIKQKFINIYQWNATFADSQLSILLEEYNEMVSLLKMNKQSVKLEVDDTHLWNVEPGRIVDKDSAPIYEVVLQSKTLGMTIENILERTYVRTVQATSEAAKLGVQNNSLLLQVGSVSTVDHTHLETLDLLKNSLRPVKLRFRRMDAESVVVKRAHMQSLVQQQKYQDQMSRSLDWLDERLLWALRMIAFAEGIRILKDLGDDAKFCSPVKISPDIPVATEDEIQRHFSFLLLAERTIAENSHREVVSSMRMNTIADILDSLYSLTKWKPFNTIQLIERDLREICFTILQLRNEPFLENPEPADIDHICINVLKSLLMFCVPDTTLQQQSIPMMWRLAVSPSITARMACSSYIAVLYPKLLISQKLQLRGLINRLSVDKFAMIRGHVLGITCPKIMPMLDASGLNWLAHCVTNSFNDDDATVRMQAITASTRIVQFYSEYKTTPLDAKYSCNPDFVPMSLYYSDTSDADKATVSGGDVEDSGTMGRGNARGKETEINDEWDGPALFKAGPSDTHLMFCRILPMITNLSEDPDPRVRSYLASCLGLFCRYMGRPWSTAIVDIMFTYFRDANERVRGDTLKSVPATARALLLEALTRVPKDPNRDASEMAAASMKFFEQFIPAITGMQKDTSVLVRGSLSAMLPQLLYYLWPPFDIEHETNITSDSNITPYMWKLCDSIAPSLMKLLADQEIQVAVKMLNALSETSEVERLQWSPLIFTSTRGPEILRALTPLASHHNWRSRHAICVVLPYLAVACSSVESRAQVAAIAVPLTTDDVFEVRRSASKALCIAGRCDLMAPLNGSIVDGMPVQDMGRMWLDGIVLPQLMELHNSKLYSDRIMALHMIYVIFTEKVVDKSDGRYAMLASIALSSADDKVANVRLALANLFKESLQLDNELPAVTNWKQISGTLTMLAKDKDKDVRTASIAALALAGSISST